MKNVMTKKEEAFRAGKFLPVPRPATMLQKFHEELDKLFEDFSTGGFGLVPSFADELISRCQPKMDVKDNGTEIVVTVELPGVEMEDLNIAATPHYLSISGEKRAEEVNKEHGYQRLEREYGFFRRVLPVPCEIDKDRVDAVLRNGLLTVTLPKTKAALDQERKVTVKAG